MKVLVLGKGELKEKEINNTLEELQKIVEGYIEIPFLSKKFNDNGIDVIINEEGKLIDGMNPEIAVVSKEHGNILDVVYGNCIFASHNDDGDTVELNEEQIAIVEKELETTAGLMMGDKNYFVRVLFI